MQVCSSGWCIHFYLLSLDVISLFGDKFLDTPMTLHERFRAAQRIQPKWSSIGRILEPEPFEHFEIHAFGEKRSDNDRALEMLDAWANKFGARATRRHFINAMKDPDVGYSNEVAPIFAGKYLVACATNSLITSFRLTLTLCVSKPPIVHVDPYIYPMHLHVIPGLLVSLCFRMHGSIMMQQFHKALTCISWSFSFRTEVGFVS